MTDEDPTPPRDPSLDPVSAPDSLGPFSAILWFLEQCRARGYRVGPYIEHAGTRLQVSDLRQAKLEGYEADHAPMGIWEAHGAKGED